MEAGGLKSERCDNTNRVSMMCSEDEGKSHEPRNAGGKKEKERQGTHNHADTLIFNSRRPISGFDLQDYNIK